VESRSIITIAKRFEELCRFVLIEQGYSDITNISSLGATGRVDFVGIHLSTRVTIVAEFKLSLSTHVRPAFIDHAIASLATTKASFENPKLLLIVTGSLSKHWRRAAHDAGISEVWDLHKLLSEASITSAYDDLRSFLVDIGVSDLGTLRDAAAVTEDDPLAQFQRSSEKLGAVLCSRINQTKNGKAGWTKFEEVCMEALDYLFGDQFGAKHKQSRSEGGIHRRDYLVRLRPNHDFWISLAHDFRSRYIVFEFKNYGRKIGQNEIYSTEKYLFTTALRSVCFIIAKKGANDNAYRAAAGALREAGKLIVIISAESLCEMLHAFDKEEEPEILLHRLLDDLLTKMLR
jgi:hypothetical protein